MFVTIAEKNTKPDFQCPYCEVSLEVMDFDSEYDEGPGRGHDCPACGQTIKLDVWTEPRFHARKV